MGAINNPVSAFIIYVALATAAAHLIGLPIKRNMIGAGTGCYIGTHLGTLIGLTVTRRTHQFFFL